MSVSVEFLMPSAQLPPAHFPAEHIWVWQSPGTVQFDPTGQPGQSPPQSTPVSVPFSTRSVQLGPGTSMPIGTSTATSVFTSAFTSSLWSMPPSRPASSSGLAPPPQPASAPTSKTTTDPIFNLSINNSSRRLECSAL